MHLDTEWSKIQENEINGIKVRAYFDTTDERDERSGSCRLCDVFLCLCPY